MYQCYYHKIVSIKYTYGERQYLGEKVLTERFEKEIDAEKYCDKHDYLDMNYDEIEVD